MRSELSASQASNQAKKTPMQGQSPYLINGGIYYQNDSSGTQISVLYNVFGPRIFLLGSLDYPSIGEIPRHTLDINVSQKIFHFLSINAGVQDLLNNPVFLVQDTDRNGKFTKDGKDKLIMKYKRGPYYTFGLRIIF